MWIIRSRCRNRNRPLEELTCSPHPHTATEGWAPSCWTYHYQRLGTNWTAGLTTTKGRPPRCWTHHYQGQGTELLPDPPTPRTQGLGTELLDTPKYQAPSCQTPLACWVLVALILGMAGGRGRSQSCNVAPNWPASTSIHCDCLTNRITVRPPN